MNISMLWPSLLNRNSHDTTPNLWFWSCLQFSSLAITSNGDGHKASRRSRRGSREENSREKVNKFKWPQETERGVYRKVMGVMKEERRSERGREKGWGVWKRKKGKMNNSLWLVMPIANLVVGITMPNFTTPKHATFKIRALLGAPSNSMKYQYYPSFKK